MTTIQKDDLVELLRNLNNDLLEGLVGRVLECHEDSFDVEFSLPGKKLEAEVRQEDVKFLVGIKPSGN